RAHAPRSAATACRPRPGRPRRCRPRGSSPRLRVDDAHGVADGAHLIGVLVAELDVELALHLEDDVDEPCRVDLELLEDVGLGRHPRQRLLVLGERLDDLDDPRERLVFGHALSFLQPSDQRFRSTHALTSPKPKLALATTSSRSGTMVWCGTRGANAAIFSWRSSQFRDPCTNRRASWSTTATSSMPPAAPSPCPTSDSVAVIHGK